MLLTSLNPTPSSFTANAASHHLIRRHPLVDGDAKIDGLDIVWSMSVSSRIFPNNHWADVTSRVKSTIDAAPAGLVDLTVTEVATAGIDGESLIVNFDDPAQTTTNTVISFFGVQGIAGDSFLIGLTDPINL